MSFNSYSIFGPDESNEAKVTMSLIASVYLALINLMKQR